ncbi:MAG: DUF2782 domain-containing protein [Xanthomonadales bacterium]|nr:DUF2782 domain-containing protein [Xanthomonadales bacterium]
MKHKLIIMLMASVLTCGLAMAQEEAAEITDPAAPPPIPPIPPKVPGEELEPSVVITEREGQRVEEYRQNGRTYMVKITPVKGPAYYYLDEDGDGELELRESDRKLNPVQPVYWKLKEW